MVKQQFCHDMLPLRLDLEQPGLDGSVRENPPKSKKPNSSPVRAPLFPVIAIETFLFSFKSVATKLADASARHPTTCLIYPRV
jgi:hypothetical protein